jgi:hypothetical protein
MKDTSNTVLDLVLIRQNILYTTDGSRILKPQAKHSLYYGFFILKPHVSLCNAAGQKHICTTINQEYFIYTWSFYETNFQLRKYSKLTKR